MTTMRLRYLDGTETDVDAITIVSDGRLAADVAQRRCTIVQVLDDDPDEDPNTPRGGG